MQQLREIIRSSNGAVDDKEFDRKALEFVMVKNRISQMVCINLSFSSNESMQMTKLINFREDSISIDNFLASSRKKKIKKFHVG